MTNAVDYQTFWGLGEMVMWIRTRDVERVAAMAGLSETDAMVLALFTCRARLHPRLLARLSVTNFDSDRQAAAPHENGEASEISEPGMMDPNRALDDLHGKIHSRRVQMTAIRCDGSSDEQTPVPPVELNDLTFRFIPGNAVAPVGLWSRSRGVLVWRSPQFLRANGLRVWPARNKKTATVSGAILRHLRKIMSREAPITKSEAQRRCLTEVPNAYLGAFKKAWAELEPSCKRGRGKHGPRGR
jgi:hypothetical protein